MDSNVKTNNGKQFLPEKKWRIKSVFVVVVRVLPLVLIHGNMRKYTHTVFFVVAVGFTLGIIKVCHLNNIIISLSHVIHKCGICVHNLGPFTNLCPFNNRIATNNNKKKICCKTIDAEELFEFFFSETQTPWSYHALHYSR